MKTIGAAAKASGISRKMIRYYEQIGLLPAPSRNESGYRYYSAAAIEQLCFIKQARELGFSLPRIQQLLSLWQNSQRHSADVKAIAEQYIEELEQSIEQLQSMRQKLLSLTEQCHGDQHPECPIINNLALKPN